GFPTSRGAKTYDEFLKQEAKIVAAIKAIDADVVGLMEIENDGDETYSAIKDLVNALNAKYGTTTYDYVPAGQISSFSSSPDEIAVGLIYKTATVSLSGVHKVLNNSFDASYNDTKNRPALAQTFEEIASGEKFTIIVNHFKSKGSGCDAIGDPNNNDGQGNCNGTRTLAAQVLADWIETDPTGSNDNDFFILGDLNSYGQEDPIDMLRKHGYTNLVENNYSYVYDGMLGTLDYALVSDSMINQVTKTEVWHINSVEPAMLSYYGKDELYDESPYRSSDHDPVIVGLNLSGIVQGSETYKVGSIAQNCADTAIKIPITTAEPVENVIGYNLSVVFDNDKLAPTGGLFLNSDLINPAYIDYMTNTSKEDTLLISMFLNSDAPAQTYFEGEGLLMEIEFRPAAGLNLGDDQTEISVSSLIESYYTGSANKVVGKGVLTSTKYSTLEGQIVFWNDVKIDFNSANSILYAPTNMYGTDYDCKQTSSVAINPDADGYFNYDLKDGRYLKIMSDIEDSVNVMPIINGYDAYLANSAILGLEDFAPTAYQLIAMDVNLDGKVLAGDVSQINQRAVSAIPEFIQKDNYNNEGVKTGDDSKDWLFVETNQSFVDITVTNIPQLPNCIEIDTNYQCKMPFTSFTGILLGDVSGSFAKMNDDNELKSSTNAVILDVNNAVSITESNMVDIPIVINAEESIHDINFELVYNTNVVKFNSLIKYTQDASSLVNETNNKHVLFSAYSMDEYAVGKALYSLRFEAMDLDLKEANFQSVTTKMSDMDANFIVTQSTNTIDIENLKVNMYPNPASSKVNMLLNKKAKVVITNQFGQNVKTFNAKQGLNTFETSELNAGIYMVQIVINNNIQTYSLIIE
ncbi:MAG: ExeM/NucH family extracellular endonuclease, partial [Bacteroidales bacterium]|nr:ExeM/NucH family extracellular endonuclease [Bacteroidales bacterium]